jgi:hypothetical protein
LLLGGRALAVVVFGYHTGKRQTTTAEIKLPSIALEQR